MRRSQCLCCNDRPATDSAHLTVDNFTAIPALVPSLSVHPTRRSFTLVVVSQTIWLLTSSLLARLLPSSLPPTVVQLTSPDYGTIRVVPVIAVVKRFIRYDTIRYDILFAPKN